MRKAIDTYLRKNKSVEIVLESMDEHMEAILIACIILTLVLYIRTPFISYVYDSLRYINPANYELFQPIAIAVMTPCGFRSILKKSFGPVIGGLFATALLIVIIDNAIYTVSWFFSNLGYILLLLSAYIILVFFGLLLLRGVYAQLGILHK